MAYKTIIVYLSKPSRAPQIMNVAINLALQNSSHLMGCHVMPEPIIPMYDIRATGLMQPVIQQQQELYKKNAGVLKKEFETAVKGAKLNYSWNCDDNFYYNYSTVISERIRGADIAIVSQYQENDGEGWNNLPARLTINSGRPVLVVPYDGQFEGMFNNVVIAWNNSRESARAVFDALPILINSKNVKILSIHSDSDESPPHPHNNIGLALKRHGVEVIVDSPVANERSMSEILISESQDFGADLLVMGCYGRPRLQEFIFGGVTRDILKSMPLPVLMSH